MLVSERKTLISETDYVGRYDRRRVVNKMPSLPCTVYIHPDYICIIIIIDLIKNFSGSIKGIEEIEFFSDALQMSTYPMHFVRVTLFSCIVC